MVTDSSLQTITTKTKNLFTVIDRVFPSPVKTDLISQRNPPVKFKVLIEQFSLDGVAQLRAVLHRQRASNTATRLHSTAPRLSDVTDEEPAQVRLVR